MIRAIAVSPVRSCVSCGREQACDRSSSSSVRSAGATRRWSAACRIVIALSWLSTEGLTSDAVRVYAYGSRFVGGLLGSVVGHRTVVLVRLRGAGWTALIAALLAAIAAVAHPSLVVRPGPVAHRGSSGGAALGRLDRMSLQAQGAISTALGRDMAAFGARRTSGGYRVAGGGVVADLSRHAVEFSAAGGSVGLSLDGPVRGGGDRGASTGAPVARLNRVLVGSGGVTQWYAAGPLGVEQGFTVNGRAAGHDGALTLALRLSGSLTPRRAGSGIVFVNHAGRVVLHYGGLDAIDASGRPLPVALVLRHRSVLIRVVDQHASYPVTIDPFIQQGQRLVGDCTAGCSGPNGTGETGIGGFFGISVALSSDGNTALIGASTDNNDEGGAWVFTRSSGVWNQQGPKLVADCTSSCGGPSGTGETGGGFFGSSVALSANGTTALIGALNDNTSVGAAWVFSSTGGVWSQQSAKLVASCTASCSGPNGTGEVGAGAFGSSVALSGDGSTALIGADGDNTGMGAAWVFTRSAAGWSQEGAKLVGDCTSACGGPSGTGETGPASFAESMAMSADGSTALVGAPGDNGGVGAVWVFSGTGGVWSQQSPKLVADCTSGCGGSNGTGEVGLGGFGESVASSSNGDTALIGAPQDSDSGAAWVFSRSAGAWSQEGAKLVGDCTSGCGGPNGTGEVGFGAFGSSVTLSSDGATALIGAWEDNTDVGAAWEFSASGAGWSQQGPKLIGDCLVNCSGPNGTGEVRTAQFGSSVTLSGDGNTALIGGPYDNAMGAHMHGVGAAWVFATPTTCADIIGRAPAGGGSVSLSLSCSGPPGAPVSYAIVSSPGHGTLGAIDQATGVGTYTPKPGYNGTDTFTYMATDRVGNSNVATATITVPPAVPSCKNVTAKTPAGGGAAQLHLSCRAPAGVPFGYTIVAAPSHGSLSAISGSGALVYVSRVGYHGSDHVTYAASDSGGRSNAATATITVPKPLGTLAFALLGWNFNWSHSYSTVQSMVASDAPIGTKLEMACKGRRCRIRQRTVTITTNSRCKRKGKLCSRKHHPHTGSADLARVLRNVRFPVGTSLNVAFAKRGYIGKIYIFKFRAGKQPSWTATCLAPGSSVPGRGC